MRNRLKKLIDWGFDNSIVISGIAMILLSVIGISNINKWTTSFLGIENFRIGKFLYILVILVALFAVAVSYSNRKENSKLEKDNEEKGNKIIDLESSLNDIINETNELFNSYLRLLISNLDFTSSERISVYKINDDKFVLLGRTSLNPILKEIGRHHYPVNKGFISLGWEESEYFIDDLPDPQDFDDYHNKCSEIRDIEKDVLRNISMKSRTYFIYRLNGYDGNAKAIMVFESLKNNAFTKEVIIEKLKGVKQPLVMFIEKNNGVIIKENKLGI